MTGLSPFHYRRALLSFMTILFIFMIFIVSLIVSSQRRYLLDETKKHMELELDVIGVAVREPMLTHDYASVEQLLTLWGEENEKIVEIKAITPNNFELVHYHRSKPFLSIYRQERYIQHAGQDLLTIKVARDFASEERIINILLLQLIFGSIVLTTFLGAALWFTLRKLAMRPLEEEIAVRKRTEVMLQNVKENLENKVRERTAELRGTNENLLLEITERKRAELALQHRIEEITALNVLNDRIITNLSLDQMVWAALDGIMTPVAPDAAMLFLHKEKQLVLQDMLSTSSRFHIDNVGLHKMGQCLCGLAAGNGEPVYSENIHVDSRCIYEECKKQGIRSFAALPLMGGGNVLGVIGLASERERNFEAQSGFLETISREIAIGLQNSLLYEQVKMNEERLRTIMENVPGAVYRHEPKPPWRATHLSEAIFALAGYPASDFLNGRSRNLGDLIHDDDAKKVEQSLNEGIASYKPFVVEYRVLHADGSIRWVYDRGRAVYDKSGNALFLDGVVIDVTELKKAEEALRFSEEKFSKAFRSSPTFITINTLEDGKYIDANDTFLEASGYSREELIDHSALELGIWADPAVRDKVVKLLKEYGVVNNLEAELRMKNNENRTVLYSAELIKIGDENCILSVKLDITERKKLERQLFQAQKMEAVGQLAGGIAHDFNNILTAIISYGYLLKNKLHDDQKSAENINKILTLSDRAAKITQGLLTFSRKQHFEFVPIKVNDVIRNIEKLLKQFIREDIELRTRLTDREPVVIADKTQLEQIIINLATNARDAMPKGGIFTLETDIVEIDNVFIKSHGFGEPGVYALLTVSDIGIGMNEQTKRKVFEPFFTTKEVGKGSGLGLAIVYGIVKQHNGFIDVYSEPDGGSVFKIYLPEIKKGIHGEKVRSLQDLRGKEETILVAEDEAAVRDSLKKILEDFGYNVIESVNGRDAVEKFMRHKEIINLLILDVIMPVMNGKEAYEEMREMNPAIKAIFTSGYTADVRQNKRIQNEDVIFVTKPIFPDNLLSKIKEVLGNGHGE